MMSKAAQEVRRDGMMFEGDCLPLAGLPVVKAKAMLKDAGNISYFADAFVNGRQVSVAHVLLRADRLGFSQRFGVKAEDDSRPAEVVRWSLHAIERTCERLAPLWDSYLGLGDVFAFFDKCLHFEQADLHGGHLGFTFYDVCAKGFFTELFARKVLGEPNGKQSYYRVGYCPAVVEGEFVKATTLLYPGFVGTPEYGTIMDSRLGREEKRRLIDQARQQSREYLEKTSDFSLVNWFHDQGVPQVIESEEELYTHKL